MPAAVGDWGSSRVKQFFQESGLSDTVATALVVELCDGSELSFACTSMTREDIVALAGLCTSRLVDKSKVVNVLLHVDWATVNLD